MAEGHHAAVGRYRGGTVTRERARGCLAWVVGTCVGCVVMAGVVHLSEVGGWPRFVGAVVLAVSVLPLGAALMRGRV